MTLQTEQPGAPIGEFFWIKWVLANAVGFAVGAAVSLSLAQYGASLLPPAGAETESMAGVVSRIMAWGSAIFDAVAIGAAQWFFLRGRVRWAGSWFLATSLGRLAGQFIIPSLAGSSGSGLLSPFFGAALGVVPVVLVALPQWLILRRHVWGAGWWVVANIAGAAVGFVGSLVGAIGSGFAAAVIPPSGVLYLAVSVGMSSATAGAGISAITGVALRQLLKRPIPETQTLPPSTIRAD